MKNSIKNIENLSAVFDSPEIPSFHDAEIVSVFLNRESNVSVEVVLRIYRLEGEINSGGKKITRWKNAYGKFRFYEAKQVNLQNFFQQNVIEDLYISRHDTDFFTVHFQSKSGCDLKFDCREIELAELKVSESVKEIQNTNS